MQPSQQKKHKKNPAHNHVEIGQSIQENRERKKTQEIVLRIARGRAQLIDPRYRVLAKRSIRDC